MIKNNKNLNNTCEVFSDLSTSSPLLPWFITGLADGEATFAIKIIKRSTNRTGWYLQPIFRIELHDREISLLKRVHSFFGVGNFRDNISHKNNNNKSLTVTFSVESIKDLTNVIIPHFNKYPLLTKKRADFELFKQIVEMMSNKEHLTMEGLKKIISIRASLNKGLTPLLKNSFPDIIPCERPKVDAPTNFDPLWLVGFIEGEGCFFVKIANLATKKGPVQLKFTISQHFRDRLLFNSLLQYLGCGRLEETPIIVRLVISKFEDIQQKVLPFFAKYPLLGVKRLDYADFCKVAELMKNKVHLTPEGIDKINSIKVKMNTGRDYSKISNMNSSSPPSSAYEKSSEISSKLTKASQDIVTESETSPGLTRR